ncbi:cell division protein ZapE [Pseudooceanicola aestuarii]|uniref:cell division protein ZapE n=1 Tax=Pseudooceanicola aestuarii TaxID=2697319 RepID=UPI001EF81DD9|nr:cell division protein ZapE [Pseudooceanicola aestuarii]
MSQSMTQIYADAVADDHLTADPAQEAVLPEFDRIREALNAPRKRGLFRRAPEPPRGLYIWGGVGRGKSMLMDLFAQSLDVPHRRVHFHAFMQEIHEGMHAARASNTADSLAPVAARVAEEVRVLAFDEMQISDIADAMIVGRLFEALFAAGVVVVTTSNRHPDDLYKDGLQRERFVPFIALVKEKMVVHELASPRDYRQNRLSGSPVYFTPANAEARAAIAAIWEDLTGGEGAPLVLKVKGRDVTLPAYRNGVARAKFHDLCGRMLGPGDYLAIADAVRVLILEDIPRLGRSNFNEAKRFVTLIDALYEARVRFICSAADAPESLYLEGEGAFEFERTASRLREMQAEDWARD